MTRVKITNTVDFKNVNIYNRTDINKISPLSIEDIERLHITIDNYSDGTFGVTRTDDDGVQYAFGDQYNVEAV